jgi:ATP-dependent protease La (LON) substrate-binding domain/Zinc finger, C3HC4 type (RING finger)
MSGNGDLPTQQLPEARLRAHEDARAIIRLFQCSQCSYPLREPMTLPCGHSLCRLCLPRLYKRENITYPLNAGRSEGFICSFNDCGLEHSLGDCSVDVTLQKLVDMMRSEITKYGLEASDTPLILDERLHWKNVVDSSKDIMPRSRVLHGGRLVATYVLADMGELNYHSEVAYTPVDPNSSDTIKALDVTVLEHLKEAIRNELECQVCYSLMLDPLTTACGHTFCRKCVARVLDHSNLCPVCRRKLPMPPGAQAEPSNKRISHILQSLMPDLLALRLVAAAQEDAIDEDESMALFPCTLAYPHMPTFLHIFEPRYRLMVRRAIESGRRRFGMMMYNQRRIPQGQLGQVHFMQYGTLLQIERVEMFPDGRSLIETKGVSRFRVLETSIRDGYYVGRIQRIDDVSLSEEEAIEARETSSETPLADDLLGQIHCMPTQRLLQLGLDFIAQARARSAPWLTENVPAGYGQPPSDPAIFPYWFASVFPIAEEEKYRLLPTNSVRERLKIVAWWIRRLEVVR